MISSSYMTTLYKILVLTILLPIQGNSQMIGDDLLRGRKKLTIPFELVGNYIVLDIIYNGIVPLKFIYDTGANNTILFEKTYPEIFYTQYSDTMKIIGADANQALNGYIVRNGTFRIANANTKNISRDYVVLSENYIKMESSLGVKIDGILGNDFFKRLTIEINYPKKRLTLWHPDKIKIHKKYETTLPITIKNGKPYVECGIDINSNTTQANLLIDTGAGTTLLLNENENIQIPQNAILSFLGNGLTGDMQGHVGIIQKLNIADIVFETFIGSFQKIDSTYLDSNIIIHRDGIIGNTILSRFDIILDMVNEKMYISKNKYFDRELMQDKSGLIIHAFGEKLRDYVVFYVYPDSPADKAGIRKDDIILRINRCKSKKIKLNKLLNKLSKEGKTITLSILRNNKEEIETSLLLSKYLK